MALHLYAGIWGKNIDLLGGGGGNSPLYPLISTLRGEGGGGSAIRVWVEGESKYNCAGGGRLDSVVYVLLVAEGNARI